MVETRVKCLKNEEVVKAEVQELPWNHTPHEKRI